MDEKGSVTIEAALALPSFILFMMAFVLIFNTLMIHKAMQEALTESALCMSSYAYIGYKTKILDIEAEASGAVKSIATSSRDQIRNVSVFYQMMKEGKTLSNSSGIDDLYIALNAATESTLEVIKDPKAFGLSLAYAICQWVYEGGKSYIISPLINMMVKEYIGNYHGLSQKAVEELWIEGDMDYLDSRYFGTTPEIKLIVHYKVRPMFFDAILPDVNLSNTVIVRCWGPGDEGKTLEKSTCIGWITPNSVNNGGVYHTMKCMSLNNNNASRNVQVEIETFTDDQGNVLFQTLEYNSKIYTHCQNCANGGGIKK